MNHHLVKFSWAGQVTWVSNLIWTGSGLTLARRYDWTEWLDWKYLMVYQLEGIEISHLCHLRCRQAHNLWLTFTYSLFFFHWSLKHRKLCALWFILSLVLIHVLLSLIYIFWNPLLREHFWASVYNSHFLHHEGSQSIISKQEIFSTDEICCHGLAALFNLCSLLVINNYFFVLISWLPTRCQRRMSGECSFTCRISCSADLWTVKQIMWWMEFYIYVHIILTA
jgi:hypothetical protein